MVDLWVEFVFAFWILFPAYAANIIPPLTRKLKTHPIDFRKKLKKHRILGSGKTFEGLALGLVFGFLVGLTETFLYPSLNAYANLWNVSLPTMNLTVAFLIPFGALIGDIVGSFVKRRFGFKRGANVILLDQLDFIFGAILFSFIFTEITIWMILIMIVITPIIHRLASIIGYKLRLKREPW